jgi:hypothetical protein
MRRVGTISMDLVSTSSHGRRGRAVNVQVTKFFVITFGTVCFVHLL